MMQTWYDMRDAVCDAYAKFDKGMIEPDLNMEIQECHWKGEVITVEIDIKNTGIGCMVWKWQAKQIWHRSVIISK